jgi:hypothetical protein
MVLTIMVVKPERTLHQTYFLGCRDQRRVHRTAMRHDRLTVADRLAYWRAAHWSRQSARSQGTRGRAGVRLPTWLRVSLALAIVALGLTASALLI